MTYKKCICERCGSEYTPTWGKQKYCGSSCAAKISNIGKKHSDETKRKISEASKGKVPANKGKKLINGYSGRNTGYALTDDQKQKQLYNVRIAMSSPEVKEKISKKMKEHYANNPMTDEHKAKVSEGVKRSHRDGRNRGWTSRNIRSYAEDCWKKVLENNSIPFTQEFSVAKSSLGFDGGASYFLDFLLIDKNIDLEIDGSQHKREERRKSDIVRDEALTKAGFFVYRIPWVNPAHDESKFKEQIQDFIVYYNTFTGYGSTW